MTNFKGMVVALVAVSGAASAQDVRQVPLPENHPLIGTWRIDLPNGCFEEYTLRADGTKSSRSADERNESVFEISPRPSPRGFYRWADKIVQGNGKPDCGGSVTALGHIAVNFIRLHPTGSRFLLCESEDMNACFAEFRRKRSSDI